MLSKRKPEEGSIFVATPLDRNKIILSALYGMAINFVKELVGEEQDQVERWALRLLEKRLHRARANMQLRMEFYSVGWEERLKEMKGKKVEVH